MNALSKIQQHNPIGTCGRPRYTVGRVLCP